MRITAKAKQEVRERILTAGRSQFQRKGFEGTTTRDLSRAAGIAIGTLFNYFPNKESLGMSILAEALERGRDRFRENVQRIPTLEEGLFALSASELREIRPYRVFVGPILETALSPFGSSQTSSEGEKARQEHLGTVAEMIINRRGPDAATSVTLHLYWSLYLGVLAFWSRDESPNQEDTLAMLDQATRLFAASLTTSARDEHEGGTR
ncbi:MAG: TetR/AcrR family transcriptional regulator [bacterium]|nr:TetR/AcrR family transcriptional regulator [bacterium]